mmetsp:Transcript_68538/g.135476  ORF Transcript_68538/g.135476 Transcript_68538/m.135476 type:complete len:80 (+) Transcript_68538:402-641(+)
MATVLPQHVTVTGLAADPAPAVNDNVGGDPLQCSASCICTAHVTAASNAHLLGLLPKPPPGLQDNDSLSEIPRRPKDME